MNTKIITKWFVALLMMGWCQVLFAGQKEVDYAAEESAFKTIRELNQLEVPIQRIAFLGLSGQDSKTMTQVFNGGLVRIPGNYSFYTRDENEWNTLMAEIEFSDRKKDIMDQTTLSHFGDIKGVDALLYGRILEASVTNGKGIFRVSMTLAKPTTGKILWAGNITGEYFLPVAEEASKKLVQAAQNVGRVAKEKLEDALKDLPDMNVFLMSLEGEQGPNLSESILSEIMVQSPKLRFFQKPTDPVDSRFINSLMSDLVDKKSGDTLNMKQLNQIVKQLDQVYNLPGGMGKEAITSVQEGRLTAYLTGTVKSATEEEGVSVNLSIRDIRNNRVLWSATAVGEPRLNRNEELSKMFKENYFLFVVLGGVVAIIVLFLIFYVMTRPR